MNKKIVAIVVVVVLVVGGGIALTTRNKSDTTSMSMTSSSSKDTVATNSVAIKNYLYGPETATVKAGDTVTWTNQDSVHHTVTTDSGDGPKSADMNQGQTYSYAFKTAGTYKYHCEIHPSMHGTVTVTQ
jgi:plastocyanin